MNTPGISEPRPPDRDRADEVRRRERVKHEQVRAARAFVVRTDAAEADVAAAEVTADVVLADRLQVAAAADTASSSSSSAADDGTQDAASASALIKAVDESLATGRSANEHEVADASEAGRRSERGAERATTRQKDSVRAEDAHADAIRDVAAHESRRKDVGRGEDEPARRDADAEGKQDVGLVVVAATPIPPVPETSAPPAAPAGLSRADFGRLVRFAEMGRDAAGRNELRVGFGAAVLGGVEVFVTSLGPRRVRLKLRGSGVAGEGGVRHAEDLRAALERRGLAVEGCVTEAGEC